MTAGQAIEPGAKSPPEPSTTTPKPTLARRRFLTILFSDLSDSTRIAATMEAEDYAELLERLRAVVERTVAHHGGIIVRVDGDGFAMLFGYPEANDDDARRATETALDVHAEARAMGAGLHLHSGIHSGLVLVNPGDIVRGRFEILGDATNVAARLADVAVADTILVSEATLGSDRHFFVTEKLPPLSLKGKDHPVAALRVSGRAPPVTRFATRKQRGFAPFVGRDGERARLEACIDDAVAGRGGLAVLAGPAGVGKTRLAEDCLATATARGCSVHRGHCESYLGAAPLQPFLLMLRSIFGLTPDVPAADARTLIRARLGDLGLGRQAPVFDRLMSLAGTPDGNTIGVGAATRAICALLSALSARAPLVLFIDDWQSTDDASRRVLDEIRQLASAPILVLLATRRFDVSERTMAAACEVALAPLTAAEARQTVAALLPSEDPFQIARIVEYSGGNPLFIEELCHAEHQGAARGGQHGATAWLDALIVSRFTRLPEPQARLARAAAVIGKTVPTWLFEQLTGCSADDPLLKALADADFLYEGHREGTIAFKHGITRQVIYRTVGLRERRRLHAEIADALRQRGGPAGEDQYCEALAYHSHEGGDPATAAGYAAQAGDKAVAISALDRAQQQYAAALAALDELPPTADIDRDWLSIFRRYVRASLFDPSQDQLPVYQRALARAQARGDAQAGAWAEYWLGCFHYPLGQPLLSIAHCENALVGARALGDARLVSQIEASLGQAAAAMGDYGRALALLDAAVAERRRGPRGSGASINLAYSLGCKGFVLADIGRFAEAHDCFAEAIAEVRGKFPEAEASLVGQHAVVMVWQGRWQEACEAAATAEAIGERIKLRYIFAMARAIGGYARWRIDADPGAAECVIEATGWLSAGSRNQFISLNHGWLAEIMLARGDIAGVRRHAACVLKRARHRDRLGEPTAWRVLARAAARAATPARRSTSHYLGRAVQAAEARQSRHELALTWLCEAELALSGSAPVAADQRLEAAGAAFAAMDMLSHGHIVDRLAEAGRPA